MPNQSFKLPVTNGHTLHVEIAGNPDGIAVLFLHGGPGAGINANFQWAFDPEQYRIIAFDQRGCGHSQPFGSLAHNTTADLIDDIEVLRNHLNIPSWQVFGGSWGATLALCYAIAHPFAVSALILRGVFLARQQDFDWFLEPDGGAARVFPDAYAKFSESIATDNTTSTDISQAFYALFSSDDDLIAKKALSAWFNWEGAISKLMPDKQMSSDTASNQQVKSLALLECHYLKHHCFIAENYILENAHQLKNIPTYIVHGRYDMVCQVSASYELHQRLALSTLHIIDDAGHSASEPATRAKLIDIMQTLAQQSINR